MGGVGLPEISGLLGNSVERQQWESGNASVRFPFADDAGPADYPFDAVADMCVVIPNGGSPSTEKISVGCLHFSSSMVSVMVYAGDSPILHCRVTASRFEPFTPYRMEAVREGCSGMVSFGAIRFDTFRNPVTLRDRVPLSEAAVMRPVVGRLKRFVQPMTGEEAKGVVGIEIPEGVRMELEPEDEEGNISVVKFSLDDAGREAVAVGCDETDNGLSRPVPVTSINGVAPNEDGLIAIVFARDESEVPE